MISPLHDKRIGIDSTPRSGSRERRADLSLLSRYLARRGLDPHAYALPLLRRRLRMLIRAIGAPSTEAYEARIRDDETERVILSSVLFGGNQAFGDDSEGWRVLTRQLRRRPPP